MRISDIKQCFSNNDDARRVVSYFWEDPLFHDKLSQYSGEQSSDAIYSFLQTEVLKELEEKNVSRYVIQDYKRLMRKLSKYLYNNEYYWVEGTGWETYYFDLKQKKDERLHRYSDVEFLYTRLNLKKEKNDIVKYASKSESIWQEIMLRENSGNSIISREDLYDCFEKGILLPLLQGNETFSYVQFHMMRKISIIAYNDEKYWATKNNLDYEKIKSSLPKRK